MNVETGNMDPNEPLGWGERIGYGIGGFPAQFIFSVVGSFFIIYMTNVALLDIAVISTIVAVSKVIDGISDVIIGNIIDNTRSRMGKARVWLLRMCIPLALSTLLLFWVPSGWPAMVKYIYVFIMYNLVNAVFLTFMQTAQYSLLALMTKNSEEQGLLGNLCSIFQRIAMLLANAGFVKLLLVFTDTPGVQNTQRAYTGSLIVCMVAITICALITVVTTTERVQEERKKKKDKLDFAKTGLESLKALLTTRYWAILLICFFLLQLVMQFALMGGTYYAMYVLGDMGHVSWLSASSMFPGFLIQFVTPYLLTRMEKKNIFILGNVIASVAGIGFGLSASNIPLMIFFNVFRGIGAGMSLAVTLGLIADTITYTDKKTGIYTAGMGNAGITACQKLGQGIGSVVFGFVLAAAGFNAASSVQPAAVTRSIASLFVWTPAILNMVSVVVFILFYDLDKKMKE